MSCSTAEAFWIGTDVVVAFTLKNLQGLPDNGATLTATLSDKDGNTIGSAITGVARTDIPNVYDVVIPSTTALNEDESYTLTTEITGSDTRKTTVRQTRVAKYFTR
ncbi:MAG: hypothetical protein AAF432_00360 [Planctomycetota bacterium]